MAIQTLLSRFYREIKLKIKVKISVAPSVKIAVSAMVVMASPKTQEPEDEAPFCL